MSDDWRLTISLRDEREALDLLEALAAFELEGRGEFGDRGIVSHDGPRGFVYAGSWGGGAGLESHPDPVALARRLESDGVPVVRRHTFLLVGAANEDEARALAERLRGEAPAGAPDQREAGG